MAERKQSLNNSEITIKTAQAGLPITGAPPIADVDYSGAGTVDVQPSDDPVVETINTLAAPRDIKIESQTIRFAPDGTQYVTVVVSFEEVEGGIDYEYRLAKG